VKECRGSPFVQLTAPMRRPAALAPLRVSFDGVLD
jgi:hypothetical protein